MNKPVGKSRTKHGFTLIELLIVVAIIAILAAIAIPNYLEAQVRAKVASSVSNLRTVALALEAYRVDQIDYPPWFMLWENEYTKIPYYLLTSPVSYLASFQAFVDPFEQHANVGYHWYRTAGKGGFCWNGTTRYWNCTPAKQDYSGRGEQLRAAKIPVPQSAPYALFGAGPNVSAQGVLAATFEQMPLYDSSNGTISPGNIWRFGP